MTQVRFSTTDYATPARQRSDDDAHDDSFHAMFDDELDDTRPIPVAVPRAKTRELSADDHAAVDERFDHSDDRHAIVRPAKPRTRSSERHTTQPRIATPAPPAPDQPRTQSAELRARTGDTWEPAVSRTQGLPTLRAPAPPQVKTAPAATPDAAPATTTDAAPTTSDAAAPAATPPVSQAMSGVVDALLGLTGAPDSPVAIDLPDPDPQVLADRVFAGAISAGDVSTHTLGVGDLDDIHDTDKIDIKDLRDLRGAPAATPLEQAIHDLLSRAPSEPARVDAPAAAAGPAEPTVQPELPAPSHLHLVMGEGDDRMVLTVAVRGSDVHVAMRGDDHIAAGLARNAAFLDDALRGRGMALAELQAHAEPEHRRHRDTAPDHEDKDPDDDERFTLEETP